MEDSPRQKPRILPGMFRLSFASCSSRSHSNIVDKSILLSNRNSSFNRFPSMCRRSTPTVLEPNPTTPRFESDPLSIQKVLDGPSSPASFTLKDVLKGRAACPTSPTVSPPNYPFRKLGKKKKHHKVIYTYIYFYSINILYSTTFNVLKLMLYIYMRVCVCVLIAARGGGGGGEGPVVQQRGREGRGGREYGHSLLIQEHVVLGLLEVPPAAYGTPPPAAEQTVVLGSGDPVDGGRTQGRHQQRQQQHEGQLRGGEEVERPVRRFPAVDGGDDHREADVRSQRFGEAAAVLPVTELSPSPQSHRRGFHRDLGSPLPSLVLKIHVTNQSPLIPSAFFRYHVLRYQVDAHFDLYLHVQTYEFPPLC
ncbi:hypothetical protein SAY87_017341 [Trapa incisa]|uniref:Uncharacterized protein n=1 Tax=Trapa incisa TaxID=236973 RepID=A0AAN7QYU7_9MYRT|nr:hypothetical protein SAY87_017341 [Trapa incisa]